MAETVPFAELMRRVRAGDQNAATDLVRRYEPAIRRVIRFRLSDTRLGAVFDSMDVCQSVMASFFVRAASGQYDLQEPEQLQKLLVAMARNKLAFQVRKQRAQRRDIRKQVGGLLEDLALPAPIDTPSRQVADADLLMAVHRKLSDEEKQLVECRNQGMEWSDIAAKLGGSPEALRKQLARALDRIASELGIDDGRIDKDQIE